MLSRRPNHSAIPIIDVFAGPGGLGEGFASLRDSQGRSAFRIKLSIEMDEFAHRTLLLRSFYRQFEPENVPDEYYSYVRGDRGWSGQSLEDLLRHFPTEGAVANSEAWRKELRSGAEREVDLRIRNALADDPSRPWVLVGGPPCQAYSLAGRARMLGPRGQEFYKDKRHTLYREYLRLLRVHKPTVFVMENVKGLLSATSQDGAGVLRTILGDLRAPDARLRYRLFALVEPSGGQDPDPDPMERLSDFVVRCEQHGIPQARHRVIIVGVRSNEPDLDLRLPRVLRSGVTAATCLDALGDLPRLRSGISKSPDSAEAWKTLLVSFLHRRWFNTLRTQNHQRLASEIARSMARLATECGRGGRFVEGEARPAFAKQWFLDKRLGGFCNHESRSHRKDDLARYIFVSAFGKAYGRSPKLSDLPADLLPEHANVERALEGGMFADRFRVQLASQPATTVTSHISKDGHYFIHHDPSQCRSLTVREAARLQTFPDNYFFEGPRTEQYRQVGNAVPPLLAKQIAEIVLLGLSSGWKRQTTRGHTQAA